MSGEYFRAFRTWSLKISCPDRFHLFRSRDKAFGHDEILQENVIIRWNKTPARSNSPVMLSTSTEANDVHKTPAMPVTLSALVDLGSNKLLMHLPADESELRAVNLLRQHSHALHTLGLSVNTGRVVAFRASQWLRTIPHKSEIVVPLIWLNHVDRGQIRWKLPCSSKPEWIAVQEETMPLLIPRDNYVLVRRFSSKDDRYRVIAAPLYAEEINSAFIGIENHLNVIGLPEASNNAETAKVVSDYLNSDSVESFMRSLSGNTQIGAAELMSLPAPAALLDSVSSNN